MITGKNQNDVARILLPNNILRDNEGNFGRLKKELNFTYGFYRPNVFHKKHSFYLKWNMHRLKIDYSWEIQSVTEINVIRIVRDCPSTIYHVHDILWVICAVIKRVFKRPKAIWWFLSLRVQRCTKKPKKSPVFIEIKLLADGWENPCSCKLSSISVARIQSGGIFYDQSWLKYILCTNVCVLCVYGLVMVNLCVIVFKPSRWRER